MSWIRLNRCGSVQELLSIFLNLGCSQHKIYESDKVRITTGTKIDGYPSTHPERMVVPYVESRRRTSYSTVDEGVFSIVT